MSNTQETKQKRPIGRPTVMTPDVIAKLEQVFAMDGTVEEACSYAEIGRNSFYDYLQINPDFSNRIEELRQRPLLKARQTIVKSLENPKDAQWYAERKMKKEFAQRTEITGLDGKDLIPDKQSKEKADEALNAFLNGSNTKDTERGESEGTTSPI